MPATHKADTLGYQIALRIPDDDLVRIDNHLSRMQESLPTLRLKRSDAMRDLLESALRQSEARATTHQ